MTTIDRSDVADEWAAAWNSHDVDRVMERYGPSPTHRMSSGSPRQGSDEICAMVRRSLDAYPDLSFTVRDSFGAARDDGWRIVIEYTMHGTQSGAINGRVGSSRSIEVDGALVARLDADGRMVDVVDYIDHHAIRVQQGTAG